MLCLDLDHFKAVNDTLGHPVGDELLKVVAERLRRCTREPDTVARLGGDEFAIIMTGMNDPSDAAALAKRIRGIHYQTLPSRWASDPRGYQYRHLAVTDRRHRT